MSVQAAISSGLPEVEYDVRNLHILDGNILCDGVVLSSHRNDMMSHKRLAARLRKGRLRAGYTQAQAAAALKVSCQQYKKYEAAVNRISAVALHHLALTFNIPLNSFFDHDRAINSPEGKSLDVYLANLFNAIEDTSDQRVLLNLAALLASKPGLTAPTDVAFSVSQKQKGSVAAKHILLVDDDVDTLCVTGALLRKTGFEVTTAASADQALRHLAKAGVVFDALITDYSMPGLSGLALIELALERSPGLPVMVITGHHRDPTLRQLPPQTRILSKPYSTKLFLAYVGHLANCSRAREVESSSFTV